jgi:YfiH family protein
MFLQPEWPAPSHIKAYTTLRTGGVSLAPYESFNLAEHVGDTVEHVYQNREILKKELHLSNEPFWITQTHSTIALKASAKNRHAEADASYTNEPNEACVVLTADCLPILLCDEKGTQVAAIHAGWRGLLNGIIPSTLKHFTSSSQDLLAWLGPAISAANYEVGDEMRDAFLKTLPECSFAFLPSPNQKWLADLYALARLSLLKQGITSIYGGNFCTYADPARFYSYRREGSKTGRMASLIWID